MKCSKQEKRRKDRVVKMKSSFVHSLKVGVSMFPNAIVVCPKYLRMQGGF